MKILIVSYFFEPEITPRAYRTAELARALARRGNDVTVLLPGKIPIKEHAASSPADLPPNLRLIFAEGDIAGPGEVKTRTRIKDRLPRWLLRGILYLYNHEYFAKYDKGIYRALVGMKEDYDLLISISYPVAIHRAVMNALRDNPSLTARTQVAEFSDPPMRGEYNRGYLPLYDRVLKRAARVYDRFSVPVGNAVPVYLKFKPRDEIEVIPQGFDNSGIVLEPYRPHERPTFAFAGRFYRNMRDPEPLLRYLAESGRDFELVLFLIDRDEYFDRMIERYNSASRGTITVCPPLPRGELIGRLATMDFLINHNVDYTSATPSKLIDYSLTGRPVYSFSSEGFDPAVLEPFLDGDYSGATPLPDPAQYDIDTIASRFEGLADR